MSPLEGPSEAAHPQDSVYAETMSPARLAELGRQALEEYRALVVGFDVQNDRLGSGLAPLEERSSLIPSE